MDRALLEELCKDIKRYAPEGELAEFTKPEKWEDFLRGYQNATMPEDLERKEGEKPWLSFYRRWRRAWRRISPRKDSKENCLLFSFWAFLRRFFPDSKAYFWAMGLMLAGGFLERKDIRTLKRSKGKAFEELITSEGKLTPAGIRVVEAARKRIEGFIARSKRATKIALSPLGAITSNFQTEF